MDGCLFTKPLRRKTARADRELQCKLSQELLAHRLIVIIEWGTWGRSERDSLRLGARALSAAVELHYLHAPADVLFDRIQPRGVEKPPIEREVLSRWSEIFEVPTPEEVALLDEPLVAGLASGSNSSTTRAGLH